MPACKHDKLLFESSAHAQEVGFTRPTPQQRVAATFGQDGPPAGHSMRYVRPSTFPAPLVLPGDDLSWDPKHRRQDLAHTATRDATGRRNKLYIVPTPTIPDKVAYVHDWAKPQVQTAKKQKGKRRAKTIDEIDIPPPNPQDVRDYVAAFYHPVATIVMENPRLEWMPWDGPPPRRPDKVFGKRIGLNIGSEAIGIRHRQSGDGIFSGQLNLNDMLDAAIAILPADAFALVMLVDQDLYEDEEDDFCCGRAYGGSRVSIVSSARYHPLLDNLQGVERDHAWPASHCQAYIDACCGNIDELPRRTKKTKTSNAEKSTAAASNKIPSTALHAALNVFTTHPKPGYRARTSPLALQTLWLSRICKTASHELGHCFGVGHCVYYACVMQGSAGLSEDARQPAYLCPVDVAKVLRATAGNERLMYNALLKVCGNWAEKDGGEMWAAFAGWVKVRMGELSLVVEREMVDLT